MALDHARRELDVGLVKLMKLVKHVRVRFSFAPLRVKTRYRAYAVILERQGARHYHTLLLFSSNEPPRTRVSSPTDASASRPREAHARPPPAPTAK